jgi:uncharacterized protein
MTVLAEILVPGPAVEGPSLVLDEPISFWGGIDPRTGRVADIRHPQHDKSVAGHILFLPGMIGSSSASSVLLELVRNGLAPAALVLDEPDAILLLGLVVAREMGWTSPPAFRLDRERHGEFAGQYLLISAEGVISASA